MFPMAGQMTQPMGPPTGMPPMKKKAKPPIAAKKHSNVNADMPPKKPPMGKPPTRLLDAMGY